jgi:hypothetical protein
LILTHSLSAGSIETPVELEKMSPPSRLGVSFEEAYLQEYDGNRHPYSYVSTLLSLDWEPWKPFVIWGQPIRWQWRASFVADSIMHGPETVYLGVAPQIRWIAPIGKTPFSLYFGGGAGAGWADASSKNTQDGGLGQPFTFILMASGGLRYDFNEHWSAWAGMAYQHLSNAKLSQPHKANLGLDSLGAMIGVGYGF